MAVARLSVTSAASNPDAATANLSDEVELYQRTYSTLLRSSGETRLRVLESSHRAMGSSLHPLAGSPELDLGAFLYAIQRLPEAIVRARIIVMGQDAAVFARRASGRWSTGRSPRRPRGGGAGTTAATRCSRCCSASESDVDDLVPSLVAFQIEWNKIHQRAVATGWPLRDGATPAALSEALGGAVDDWARLRDIWGDAFEARLTTIVERTKSMRLRQLGGTQVGYQRMTRRWWSPAHATLEAKRLLDAPLYFVSSNTHSLSNLVTGLARENEDELVAFVEQGDHDDLQEELMRFRSGAAEGSWENFLYFVARDYAEANPAGREERTKAELAAGVEHLRSHTALRVASQVIPLAGLDPRRLDPRLGAVDAERLSRSDAVIVNVDYPLGLAAYNLLHEVAVDSSGLRGAYILGKAATLNADVGDVMISSVIHDEHTSTTYWLDNAFTVDDIAPDLMFGTGLDNQRAVTVKSTFLQNRAYLDFYYREAFTVVEMEAGPYCSAVYEIADADRHPVGEAVNFSKLPIDFGIIHYASDTPYTQARTLGARGLSYYGMDSTYASSLAILRRVLRLEGALA